MTGSGVSRSYNARSHRPLGSGSSAVTVRVGGSGLPTRTIPSVCPTPFCRGLVRRDRGRQALFVAVVLDPDDPDPPDEPDDPPDDEPFDEDSPEPDPDEPDSFDEEPESDDPDPDEPESDDPDPEVDEADSDAAASDEDEEPDAPFRLSLR